MNGDTFEAHFPRTGNGPYRLLRGGSNALIERFQRSLQRPREAQERRLQVILRGARGTAFGDAHDLDRVRSLDEFRAAVPVRSHEQLRPWLDRVAAAERGVLTRERVRMLLETSGTTGQPKHLPVTDTWARGVAQAQRLWVIAMVRDHEQAARGRALTVVSSDRHALSPGGLPIGSNTGRMHRAQPWWVRVRYPVPFSVFGLDPQEVRQYAILRFALQSRITTITTANPSTILLLRRRLDQWREPLSQDLADGTLRQGPARQLPTATRRGLERRLRRHAVPSDWRPAKLWPLALVNCWKGGPAGFFVERLPAALGARLPVREVGISASEGHIALPLGDDWDGGVLWTLGHLLEFIDEDGAPYWSWEIQAGRRYRVVLSTEAGLYRYDLADLVEVVGFARNTPVVRFVGKSGRYLNTVGERVTEAQVSEAMQRAAALTGLVPRGFTVRVVPAELPRYTVAVELRGSGAERLVSAFDQALGGVNAEYKGRRDSGRIGSAQALVLPQGSYARYRAARIAQGAPEGQVKDPVTATDDAEWQRIVGA